MEYCGMDNETGEKLIWDMIMSISKKAEDSDAYSEADAYDDLRQTIGAITATHPEVYDTDVRSFITGELDPVWRETWGTLIDQWQFA